MYNVRDLNLKPQCSFYARETSKQFTHSEILCKSDMNVSDRHEYRVSSAYKVDRLGNCDGEYYKNYDHDETPVKDSSIQSQYSETGGKDSLTNSDLDKLELRIYSNISEELQTDESSGRSLESNIKFFKMTVQELFDNFYANMKDFEFYKKRFHEILEKNNEESLVDMEAFIKDVIQHISDCESSISHNSNSTEIFEITYDINENSNNPSNTSEAENFASSDVTNENLKKTCSSINKEEIYNIFLLSSDPCVKIKMNDRNLLSEINIKNPRKDFFNKQIASADNLKKLAAKKVEIDKYVGHRQENELSDLEIPVKVSYAKKNIHTDEDFIQSSGDSKSFVKRICNYLCNKFRKTSLGQIQ